MLRAGWWVVISVVLAVTSGCSTPSDAADESAESGPSASKAEPIQASPETTQTLGVSTWQLDHTASTMTVYGHDADDQIRTSVHFSVAKDADGNAILGIGTDDSARILLKVISRQKFELLENTIGRRTDVAKIVERLKADINASGTANANTGTGLAKSSIAPLDFWDDATNLIVPTDCKNPGWLTALACVGTVADVTAVGLVCGVTVGIGCPAAAAGGVAVGAVPAGNCTAGLTCAAQGH